MNNICGNLEDDNATMIACAAYPQYLKNDFTDFKLNGKSQEYFFKK